MSFLSIITAASTAAESAAESIAETVAETAAEGGAVTSMVPEDFASTMPCACQFCQSFLW